MMCQTDMFLTGHASEDVPEVTSQRRTLVALKGDTNMPRRRKQTDAHHAFCLYSTIERSGQRKLKPTQQCATLEWTPERTLSDL